MPKGRSNNPEITKEKQRLNALIQHKRMKFGFGTGSFVGGRYERTKEWRERQKQKMIGTHYHLGFRNIIESKERMRLSAVKRGYIHGSGFLSGEKNLNFNNWSSLEPYSKEFTDKLKKQIKELYNYQCQMCRRFEKDLRTKRGNQGYLFIHHIDYDKKNSDKKNLIPLCGSCHTKTNHRRRLWNRYYNFFVFATAMDKYAERHPEELILLA